MLAFVWILQGPQRTSNTRTNIVRVFFSPCKTKSFGAYVIVSHLRAKTSLSLSLSAEVLSC